MYIVLRITETRGNSDFKELQLRFNQCHWSHRIFMGRRTKSVILMLNKYYLNANFLTQKTKMDSDGESIPHTAYSSDLISSDFHLFQCRITSMFENLMMSWLFRISLINGMCRRQSFHENRVQINPESLCMSI